MVQLSNPVGMMSIPVTNYLNVDLTRQLASVDVCNSLIGINEIKQMRGKIAHHLVIVELNGGIGPLRRLLSKCLRKST
jgi:hypothetical protein